MDREVRAEGLGLRVLLQGGDPILSAGVLWEDDYLSTHGQEADYDIVVSARSPADRPQPQILAAWQWTRRTNGRRLELRVCSTGRESGFSNPKPVRLGARAEAIS